MTSLSFDMNVTNDTTIINKYNGSAHHYLKGYPTADINSDDVSLMNHFVIGDNENYGGIKNPSLYPGGIYSILVMVSGNLGNEKLSSLSKMSKQVQVLSSDPTRKDGTNNDSHGVSTGVAALIVLIIIAAVIIVAFLMYKRKLRFDSHCFDFTRINSTFRKSYLSYEDLRSRMTKHKNMGVDPFGEATGLRHSLASLVDSPLHSKYTPERKASNPLVTNNSNMVAIDDLIRHIDGESDSGVTITDEYKLLPKSFQFQMPTMLAGTNTNNVSKNRVPTKVPFDKNRVLLEDSKCDYINASYVYGYPRGKCYIVTQTPMLETIEDFWSLVWEQSVDTIVMLHSSQEVNEIPHGIYWPENEPQTFNGITVQLTNYNVCSQYSERTFAVSKIGTDKINIVDHFQYRSWSSADTPKKSQLFVDFVCKIQDQRDDRVSSPIVVHCPYAAGRCGLFVALDSLLTQAGTKQCVDVFRFVTRLLGERVHIIESLAQYKCIYKCLAEKLCPDEITEVKKRVSWTPDQFQGAGEYNYESLVSDCKEPKSSRRRLYDDYKETDRIEPVWCNGMQELPDTSFLNLGESFYIMTVPPTEEIFTDFWDVIFSTKASTIIGTDVHSQFWPTEKTSIELDHLTVENKLERIYGSYSVRTLGISKTADVTHGFYVKQYHITLTNKGFPSAGVLFEIISQVRDWRKNQSPSPILVHCKDAVTFSAVFCALMYIVDSVDNGRCSDVEVARYRLDVQCPNLIYGKVRQTRRDSLKYTYMYSVMFHKIYFLKRGSIP